MIQLLICGMNRTQYLPQVIDSWANNHWDLYVSHLEFHDQGGKLGMAAAINLAWRQILTYEWDYLLHAEEDMLLLGPLPLDAAIAALEADASLAQMLFQRKPWWGSDVEMQTGSVLGAIQQVSTDFRQYDDYATHQHIFSLNPCLIPRRVVELGWPVGNESGMTEQLTAAGYRFGCWGHPDSPPLIEHLGHERSEGWRL